MGYSQNLKEIANKLEIQELAPYERNQIVYFVDDPDTLGINLWSMDKKVLALDLEFHLDDTYEIKAISNLE